MKVVDAGVVIQLLVSDLSAEVLGDEPLAAPHLIDSEVTNVLRRLVFQNVLSEEQAAEALHGFARLTLNRFSAAFLRRRMWDHRHNLSAYDATYVALAEALAEALGATSLLTTDAKLAAAPGVACDIELV